MTDKLTELMDATDKLLDRGRDLFGDPVSREHRQKIKNLIADPNPATWEEAHGVMLRGLGSPDKPSTVWQMVNDEWPNVRPRSTDQRGKVVEEWDNLPDSATIQKALWHHLSPPDPLEDLRPAQEEPAHVLHGPWKGAGDVVHVDFRAPRERHPSAQPGLHDGPMVDCEECNRLRSENRSSGSDTNYCSRCGHVADPSDPSTRAVVKGNDWVYEHGWHKEASKVGHWEELQKEAKRSEGPYIPDAETLAGLQDDLEIALESDARLAAHHEREAKTYCPGGPLCDHRSGLCEKVETGQVPSIDDVTEDENEADISPEDAETERRVQEVLQDRADEAEYQRNAKVATNWTSDGLAIENGFDVISSEDESSTIILADVQTQGWERESVNDGDSCPWCGFNEAETPGILSKIREDGTLECQRCKIRLRNKQADASAEEATEDYDTAMWGAFPPEEGATPDRIGQVSDLATPEYALEDEPDNGDSLLFM